MEDPLPKALHVKMSDLVTAHQTNIIILLEEERYSSIRSCREYGPDDKVPNHTQRNSCP